MTQADSVHSTPPLNTSANNLLGLARQQRDREKALKRIAKLRRRASDEIERLLAFLDASDPYATSRRKGQFWHVRNLSGGQNSSPRGPCCAGSIMAWLYVAPRWPHLPKTKSGFEIGQAHASGD